MHYGTFNNPPAYTEQSDPIGSVKRAAREEGIEVRLAAPGAILEIAS
jgi:hypothetical protein